MNPVIADTILISDLHLGSEVSRAREAAAFLTHAVFNRLVLAQELGTTSDMKTLAADLLAAKPRPVAVGRMTAQNGNETVTRYFGAAAGVGADARVICSIDPAHKARIGIAAYYIEAARQLLFSRDAFPEFVVEFTDSHTGQRRSEKVTQAIVERVTYFGRCLAGRNCHGLSQGGFRLVLFKTARRSAFLAFGARVLAARFASRPSPLRNVEVAHAREIVFLPSESSPAPVLAEVDGEPVGQLPAKIEVATQAIRLLVTKAADWGER